MSDECVIDRSNTKYLLHATVRTVGDTVTKGIVGNGTNRGIHDILQHNVLRILGTNASDFEQTETGLEEKANDSHNEHEKDVERQGELGNVGLQRGNGSFRIIRHGVG